MVQPLHGLRGQGKWNLLDNACVDVEKKADLPCGLSPAAGLPERGERARLRGVEQGKFIWREKGGACIVFVGLLCVIFLQPAAPDQPADEKKAEKPVTACLGTGTRLSGRSGRGRHHRRQGAERETALSKAGGLVKTAPRGKKRARDNGG